MRVLSREVEMANDNPIESVPASAKPAFAESASPVQAKTNKSEDKPKRGTRRHRRVRKYKSTLPPFSLRLTPLERQKLEAMAGNVPLGAYIRTVLFGDDVEPRQARGIKPVEDHRALATVLGQLGKSRLANNVNQLARAVNTGSLPVTPETEADLQEACADIRRIRIDLMKALGLKPEPEP